MPNPKRLVLTDDVNDGQDPLPVSLVGLDDEIDDAITAQGLGTAAEADVAAFVAVDDTPADAAAVAADLEALRDALVTAGLMEAS